MSLSRSLSLTQATALNMIDMVGIGPFVVMGGATGMVAMTEGPICLLAWVIGAVLAFADGAVWAELGAKWPAAGGSYIFLQKLFPGKMGRMMPFLFTWQTSIQAPLVMASASIGFAAYFNYLIPLSAIQQKALSGAVVLLMTWLLYRDIQRVGRLGLVMGLITVSTIVWMIASGIPQFNTAQAFNFAMPAHTTGLSLFFLLGNVTSSAVYSYLGYYNVCHLGSEIKNPKRNIPKAIFISITCITILYLLMQSMLMGVLPWEQIAGSPFAVSLYFEHLYNPLVAKAATVLVLAIALSSLFAVMLGYSRIPYQAALNGHFFSVFAKVHPKHKIPHISLLALGGLAFIFSLLLKLTHVIKAIVVVRIFIQFIAQAVGVMAWHYRDPNAERPWRMWLFPVPALLSISMWLFIFFNSPIEYILGASGFILLGVLLYFMIPWKLRLNQ